jgi:hypothetical protein
MTETLQGTCYEPGCAAGTGGACIENLPLGDCPNFVVGPPEADSTPLPSVDDDDAPLTQRGGEAFDASELDLFLRSAEGAVRTVALFGDPEAGKTTLLAALYELLRAQRMAAGFGGSETLRGFEHRCLLARTASGRRVAATLRTRQLQELGFLHLDVVGPHRHRTGLVISDRAGELFEAVLKRPDDVRNLKELGRFDVVAGLVDGAALLDVNRRQQQITRMRRMWMAMADAGFLVPGRRYELILTKADEIDKDPDNRATAVAMFEALAAELTKRYPTIALSTAQIAARPPKSGGFPYGMGVEDLLTHWLERPAPKAYRGPRLDRSCASAFDAWAGRFLGAKVAS